MAADSERPCFCALPWPSNSPLSSPVGHCSPSLSAARGLRFFPPPPLPPLPPSVILSLSLSDPLSFITVFASGANSEPAAAATAAATPLALARRGGIFRMPKNLRNSGCVGGGGGGLRGGSCCTVQRAESNAPQDDGRGGKCGGSRPHSPVERGMFAAALPPSPAARLTPRAAQIELEACCRVVVPHSPPSPSPLGRWRSKSARTARRTRRRANRSWRWARSTSSPSTTCFRPTAGR